MNTEHETLHEDTEAMVVRTPAATSIRHDLSPESLRAEIVRQQQMQQIMTEYVRESLVKDHHYYSFSDGAKPALTKDGAYRICSLFKITPGQVEIEEVRDGDHYTVKSTARLFNQDGVEVASSRGICSTRESKYAARWVYSEQVPKDVDLASLKSRSGTKRNGGTWVQYQLPNPDLADLENTVLKMSEKRATVGAVNKLPLVSELFAADPDHRPTYEQKPKAEKAQAPAKPAEPADDPAEIAELRKKAWAMLAEKVGDDEADQKAFLKNRDIELLPKKALDTMLEQLDAL